MRKNMEGVNRTAMTSANFHPSDMAKMRDAKSKDKEQGDFNEIFQSIVISPFRHYSYQ